jgi:hypothetical protein
MWHPVFMKNKNMREMEKYWAEQAAKKAKAAKKKQTEPPNTTQNTSTDTAESTDQK